MKKGIVIFCIAICILSSCSVEERNSNSVISILNGTWYETEKELSIDEVKGLITTMNDDVGKAGSSNTKIAHFSWGNGVINSGMWSFDVARMVFSEVGSSAEILKINHEKKTGLFEIEFVIEKTYDEKNKVTTYKTQKFTLKKLSEDRLEILDTDYVFGMPAEKDDRFYLYRISGPAL